ncbi:unnamed protein product [Adineta ricciae]|uniref:Uncharacterized protein n=1 Tax=Adineta ricciae TaxID=249248 RepID=A0A815Z570_ADIRI|nr:unnamed protein product [Adineta ricciae]CAF1580288.1 unnamed protein product [Adineta ricciae]
MTIRTTLATMLFVVLLAQICENANGQKCPEAEGACVGLGGGDLCNDRCKACGYKKGECGGTLWQTCQCFRTRAELLAARARDELLRTMVEENDSICPDEPEKCREQCKTNGHLTGRCLADRCKCL